MQFTTLMFFLLSQELEPCIGCMQTIANIKLIKNCQEPNEGECQQCYCRPMWCLTCMGKWFASRQDQQHPETWLSSQVPCPTCRAKFCILDVCLIRWIVTWVCFNFFYLTVFHSGFGLRPARFVSETSCSTRVQTLKVSFTVLKTDVNLFSSFPLLPYLWILLTWCQLLDFNFV